MSIFQKIKFEELIMPGNSAAPDKEAGESLPSKSIYLVFDNGYGLSVQQRRGVSYCDFPTQRDPVGTFEVLPIWIFTSGSVKAPDLSEDQQDLIRLINEGLGDRGYQGPEAVEELICQIAALPKPADFTESELESRAREQYTSRKFQRLTNEDIFGPPQATHQPAAIFSAGSFVPKEP